jgi:ubiquitin carboxyl-terminal hydrolase 1
LDAYSKLEPIEGVECSKCTLLKAQRLLTKLVERMRGSGSNDEQLAEPLRRLAAVEMALENDDFGDKTIAEKCKITAQGRVSSTKTKQVVIARPPRSLAIHMNRSVFDPSTFNMMKNSAPVSFPLTLDLGPWCLGSKTMHSGEESTETDMNAELWALNPRASMIAGDCETSRLSGPIYELRAAVTHSDRHENGHYICYRRHARHKPPVSVTASKDPGSKDPPLEDQDDVQSTDGSETSHGILGEQSVAKGDVDENEMVWWRLSDHNVSRVDEETILSLSSGVFMLFYDCVDPSMVVNEDFDVMEDAQTTLSPAPILDGALPIATPELTGDGGEDGGHTESEGPGTPRNPDELAEEGDIRRPDSRTAKHMVTDSMQGEGREITAGHVAHTASS